MSVSGHATQGASSEHYTIDLISWFSLWAFRRFVDSHFVDGKHRSPFAITEEPDAREGFWGAGR